MVLKLSGVEGVYIDHKVVVTANWKGTVGVWNHTQWEERTYSKHNDHIKLTDRQKPYTCIQRKVDWETISVNAMVLLPLWQNSPYHQVALQLQQNSWLKGNNTRDPTVSLCKDDTAQGADNCKDNTSTTQHNRVKDNQQRDNTNQSVKNTIVISKRKSGEMSIQASTKSHKIWSCTFWHKMMAIKTSPETKLPTVSMNVLMTGTQKSTPMKTMKHHLSTTEGVKRLLF